MSTPIFLDVPQWYCGEDAVAEALEGDLGEGGLMKNIITIAVVVVVGLVVLMLCAGGCDVFVGDETRRTRAGSGATIAEIDAVTRLSFDSERKTGYESIAAREGLGAAAQVHLVEAVLDRLSFDNAKEQVLLTLIENPDFCRAAKREILERIDSLAFESSKKKILKAINDRKRD